MKKNLVIALCCIVMSIELICILGYVSRIDSLSCELEELKNSDTNEEFIVMNELTDEELVRMSLAKDYDLSKYRLEVTDGESVYDSFLNFQLYDETGKFVLGGIWNRYQTMYKLYNDYMLVPKD